MRKNRSLSAPVLQAAVGLIVSALITSCGDATGPDTGPVEELDLSLLFAPPTAAEIGTILSDWADREVVSEDVVELTQGVLPFGSEGMEVRVVSHRVGDVVHVGAIAVPVGADPGSLPLVVYSHGGDQGENLDVILPSLPLALGEYVDDFVFLVPSFRSERLRFNGVDYRSGGNPSPWDRDVDDALALLEVAYASVPEADPTRVGVLGFSRGANVGLLMAIRDPRIDRVVEFFGPTDFFGPFVRGVVEDALGGTLQALPGVEFLNQAFIQPLKRGEISLSEVRLELLRRSPVYFPDRLPDVQVHHGTADGVVPVDEGQRLIEVMSGLGRTEPGFEAFIYQGGTHSFLTLPGSLPRTQVFLSRLLAGS